jgi:hypothetical protein
VITEIAVERVRFRCRESHWECEADYDVVIHEDASGDTWELFSFNGQPVLSPYDVDGAPFCPVCHRAVPGRPVARRFVPIPPDSGPQSGRRLSETDEHRNRQEPMPLLSGQVDGHGGGRES